MKSELQSWSIIIFCYNEEGNLSSVIEKSLYTLGLIAPQSNELIIVDDGSADSTIEIANDYASKNDNIKVISHPTNYGIGAALRSGYKVAQYENVCAVPGDGQFDVEELVAHRTVPGKTIIAFYRKHNLHYSLWRETLTNANRKLNEWILGVKMRDVNWIKIYKLEELRKIKLNIKSSLVESEICAKLVINGNKVIEVPSKYLERNYGVDKGASFKIVWQAFRDTLNLAREIARFKRSKNKQITKPV